ncbi:MAG: 50S ribosomal protein L20 [Candidatus Brocadiae bacterium]|nr:50S ribosomal protein L20 [Candidatus Brocadiia bacterium]
MRVTSHVQRHKRNKKTLKAARGYIGGRSRMLRLAKQSVLRAGVHSYFGRHERARRMRALWIQRISAACVALGTSYSRFISAIRKAGVELDRKSLSLIAMDEPKAFEQLVAMAKG